MNKFQRQKGLYSSRTDWNEYPLYSAIVCFVLIYLSPFVSLWLNYLAFAIFLYRIIRYDESVFAIDYCALAGVSYIFLTTGRVSLLAWLSIAAVLGYVVKNGVLDTPSLVWLVILLDYMLLRMQTAINEFVLCFSQLALLFILISTQKKGTIVQSAQAFCFSVFFSSVYSLIFRNTAQLRSLLGSEKAAYWGSSLMRFQGLFRDPNYYMTTVVIAIALIAVLWINKDISNRTFIGGACCLVFFGALTYSKTFIIVLAVCALIFVAMLFYKKHYLLGSISIIVGCVMAVVLAKTLFSVTLYRIFSTNNLYDFTTGRSELYVEYFYEITSSAGFLLFGKGLSADILERGTHNLFLEIIYYFGAVGFFLMMAYFFSLLHLMKRSFIENGKEQKGVFPYSVLIIFAILFCTLQGMTFAITYVMLYLSIVATKISPQHGSVSTVSRIQEQD